MALGTHHQAGLQHMANLRQEASAHPVVLVHQHQWVVNQQTTQAVKPQEQCIVVANQQLP
jgi:hypothetical protein